MKLDFAALMQAPAAGEILAMLAAGERVLGLSIEHLGRAARPSEDASRRAPSTIALLPLQGALRARDGNSMERFRGRLADAAANPDVGAIVLDIDSPGGTVAGTPETAAAVRAAAQAKPVVALADTLCASAAYWIGSQASKFWVAPSAEVGSIGVIAMHLDLSKALEDAGIKATLIRSGKYKAEGNMFQPLAPEAQDNIQAEADAAHEDFIRAVAQGRNRSLADVRETFGQGRTVTAQRAVQLGMADHVGGLTDVLASLRTSTGAVRRRSAVFL